MNERKKEIMILIKGAGDLATGIAHRLKVCGFSIVMTEIEMPTTVRRTVAFSQAVFDGKTEVEGVKAVLVHNFNEINEVLNDGNIPVIIDPECKAVKKIKPDIVVDAIISKVNCAKTSINDAPVVIAVGPGFKAGADCHCVIESQRGHYLGRTIYHGSAIPDTGIPGNIGGNGTMKGLRELDEKRVSEGKGKVTYVAVINKCDTDEFLKRGEIIGALLEEKKINNLITSFKE